jgi:hypothetical protein
MRTMKFLPRDQVEALVREVEREAYGYALAVDTLPDSAAGVLLEAFAGEAPSFARSPDPANISDRLRRRMQSRSPRRATPVTYDPVPVPAELHTRLVDCVEEQQFVEPTGRRKAILLSLLGAALVLGLIAIEWVRLDALAAARPTITNATPAAGARDVPLRGDLIVNFGHRLTARPRLRLEPADGTLATGNWDGTTLVVGYAGLRYAARYQLVLDADYVSRYKDSGQYEKRWSFVTERYPILESVDPPGGGTVVARNGVLSIEFNDQPTVEPRVTLDPPDWTVHAQSWNGSTWTVPYEGLRPSTRYHATVVVDYGVASANLRQSWTFTTEPGQPPPGTPVLWHSGNDPANHASVQRTLALDWNGNVVGSIYQPVTIQSTDGSIVGTADGSYFDRDGGRLSLLSGIPYYPVVADDDRSVCELSGNVNGRAMDQLWLMTGRVDGPLHAVAPVGSSSGQSGLGIIACSALNDRAVIAYSGVGGTSAVKVIALSSGRVVYQQTYTLATSNVVSSHDGNYLAEEIPVAGSMGAPSTTLIRRTADGAIVARLDRQVAVRFSWDDRRVVTSTPYVAGQANVVTLMDWQSQRVVWTLPSSPGQGQPVFAWAEPNGTKVAIAGSGNAAWPLDALWLVDADGQARKVLSETFYPASLSGF